MKTDWEYSLSSSEHLVQLARAGTLLVTAISDDGGTVVVAMWRMILFAKRRVTYQSRFGPPLRGKSQKVSMQWVTHLKWAINRCDSCVRVVVLTAEDMQATPRVVRSCYPDDALVDADHSLQCQDRMLPSPHSVNASCCRCRSFLRLKAMPKSSPITREHILDAMTRMGTGPSRWPSGSGRTTYVVIDPRTVPRIRQALVLTTAAEMAIGDRRHPIFSGGEPTNKRLRDLAVLSCRESSFRQTGFLTSWPPDPSP